jgi:peptidoglycan/LPS O-acetylase OafA/YrhL
LEFGIGTRSLAWHVGFSNQKLSDALGIGGAFVQMSQSRGVHHIAGTDCSQPLAARQDRACRPAKGGDARREMFSAVVWKPAAPKGVYSHQRPHGTIRHRADIDGLRAMAVIPVLLYHAGIAPFAGGYVGVDIFFVISGYLITSIILADVQDGRFSVWRFYERRIRRIFPALFAMLFVCLVVGLVLLMPADFRRLGAAAAAMTMFASNILFARQAGYFDSGADLNPLLHTWSLAVEEQFYLVFPWIIAAIPLVSTRLLLLILGALAVLSFAWGVVHLMYNPIGAFYLPGGRAWELLLGGMISIHRHAPAPDRGLAELIGATGAGLIAWSVVTFSTATPFPGAHALAPCLGAALIIYSGSYHRTAVARLLSLPVLGFIGVISYSLYLWHWPMLGMTRYYLMRDITASEAALVLLAAVGVAILSWRYIEMPFRRGGAFGNARPRRMFAATGVVMAISFAVGGALYISDGWPQRLPGDVGRLAMGAIDTAAKRSSCNTIAPHDIAAGRTCKLGAPAPGGELSFAVFGDSIGSSLLPAIDAVAALHGRKGVELTRGGCYPLVGISQASDPPEHRRSCTAFVNASVDYINAHPTITSVIIAGRWTSAAEGGRFGANMTSDWYITDAESKSTGYTENKDVFIRAITRDVNAFAGRRVFVAMSVPEQKVDVPRIAALARYLGREVGLDVDRREFDHRQRFVNVVLTELSTRLGFALLDLGRWFCTANVCPATRGDVSLYSDDNHLSREGALTVKDAFAPVFE